MFLLRIIREIGVIKRAARRRYYMVFKPDYVREQIKKRKGACGYHGCCALSVLSRLYNIHFRKCLAIRESARCLRWKDVPKECQVYPLDERDKIPETKSYCNFYWDDNK